MNKVFLSGNVTADPNSGQSDSGVTYCRFTLAVSRRFSKEDVTDFFNIVTFKNTADYCAKYIEKGIRATVIGNIQTRSYEKDGVKRTSIDIVAEEVEINFKSKAGSNDERPESKARAPKKELEDTNDDLPF